MVDGVVREVEACFLCTGEASGVGQEEDDEGKYRDMKVYEMGPRICAYQ